MRPLYDPATQRPEDARACIDTFEFPDVPCAWPVVWVRASEAAALCQAQGKRLCDAHEWEGACAGALQPPDYHFELPVSERRAAHNAQAQRSWGRSAGSTCPTSSTKSPGCDGSDWRLCGSNTFPAGAFPGCVSGLGVADLHGNAAEHMNLPLTAEQLSSQGALQLGRTEMKGSWFVWDTYRAHEDWCRWRAPAWHATTVGAPDSHRNYHLGFRCCKSITDP
jgi:formylglycine-generating enzyme required for sulfatase activity